MIILLIGKAGAGKDEFAKIAEEEFGVKRVAFGDAVKEEVAAFLDKHEVCWEHRHLWGDQKDKEAWLRMAHSNRPKRGPLSKFLTNYGDYNNGWHYFTPRSLLQFFGTDYRRAQDPLYWVKAAEKKLDETGAYCLSDGRFCNEYDMVIRRGGRVIRINRPEAPQISNMNHASEVEQDSITAQHTIQNNGTIQQYHDQVRTLLKEILYGK